MQGRYVNVAGRAAEAASYIRPEILAISNARIKRFLASAVLAPYRLLLERLLRYKPHTLGKKEEKLLAMQTEMAQTVGQVFRQLNDADLKFGAVENERGQRIELSHATFSTLLHSPKRSVRKAAFHRYYRQYADHRHTLAAALGGSVQRDIYYARARNHASALEAALFPDRVPVSVYDNLIASVHRHLPAVHRYYDVRRRKMRLNRIHHYDTYVPILAERQTRHTWNQAVAAVLAAMEPLGSDYCGALERGLLGRWCDRYENRGKQSGAFSAGSYDADPYILMNYQPDVLDHVFTLAHEAGHSMHSRYSAKHQPYTYYNYTIFVAEVASTFNEQLLSRHLLARACDDQQRAFLVNRQIDAMRGTIIRQTMFAEFEKLEHATAESGEPLTIDRFQEIYRELLGRYFGPDFTLDDELNLECLRIPHFYRAFYVYKYATGMSAAIALCERVLGGEKGTGPICRRPTLRVGARFRCYAKWTCPLFAGRLSAVPRRRLLQRPLNAARGRRRHGAAAAIDARYGNSASWWMNWIGSLIQAKHDAIERNKSSRPAIPTSRFWRGAAAGTVRPDHARPAVPGGGAVPTGRPQGMVARRCPLRRT